MRQNNGSHRYQVLIPGTCKCYFIGKRVFARVINLRILRLSEWVLNAITIVLTREAEGDSTNIEEKMGEIGVMGPQATECWQPPEAGRGKEWILL